MWPRLRTEAMKKVGSLQLAYGGDHYLDRTWALETGRVQPEGILLGYEVVELKEHFRRMATDAPYPLAEMSLSSVIALVSRGDHHLRAVPVFTSRCFRHSQIYVHENSGVATPTDLIGKRVGVPEYSMTAALWVRALLLHEYGVSAEDIEWWTGGLSEPQWVERMPLHLPQGVRLRRIPEGHTLEQMLDRGELEAFVGTRAPEPFRRGTGTVRRLFPDYRSVELDYYRRTGFFPVMHVVVVRDDIYEATPWVPLSVCIAFQESKRIGTLRLAEMDTLGVIHPWMQDELLVLADIFHGDPFRYGFHVNLDLLSAMCGYSYEQGLSERLVDPEELFAAETLKWEPKHHLWPSTERPG